MGVSHFLEHMMFKGTETRTAEDVNRGFDDLGCQSQRLHHHRNHGVLRPCSLRCTWMIPSTSWRTSFGHRSGPRISTRRKGVILEEIAMYDDQPFWVLFEQGLERYFGGHPLAHRVLGTKQTVSRSPTGTDAGVLRPTLLRRQRCARRVGSGRLRPSRRTKPRRSVVTGRRVNRVEPTRTRSSHQANSKSIFPILSSGTSC